MRPISLRHLAIAKQSLPVGLCNGIVSRWCVHPKESEYVALSSFIGDLGQVDSSFEDHLFKLLDGCYFGFTIPQISKEFDCLWIGEDSIINIELKSGPKPEEDLKKQLVQNRYYLGPLKKSVLSYTYVSSSHSCYQIDESGTLSAISIIEVAKALYQIHKKPLFLGAIEDLFHPEEYLVSPFNSTEAFLRGEYFLTGQQEEIKKRIITAINNPAGPSILAITGGPGSGKTLLLYDIARSLMQAGMKVIIGHGGGLNHGHDLMRNNGWDIRPTKDLFVFNFDLSMTNGISRVPVGDADVYLMDESQRSPDVEWVADEVNRKGKKCIFAFDSNQYLNEKEFQRNNEAKIVALSSPNEVFRLTSSIRTNEAVYEFVNALFDVNKTVHRSIVDCVEVTYCSSVAHVQYTLEMLKERGYQVPRFTPNASDYHPRNDYEDWFLPTGLSAHEIIGQEFDAVVGLISPNMVYGHDGKLISRHNYYYIEDRMLYQILSRARKRIHLVIFNNQPMLQRCLDLLK